MKVTLELDPYVVKSIMFALENWEKELGGESTMGHCHPYNVLHSIREQLKKESKSISSRIKGIQDSIELLEEMITGIKV